MKRLYLFLGVTACMLLLFGFISENPLEKLLSQLGRFNSERPQEKIHLQLDKPFYAAGDTIWLKAYIVNAEKNELSALSKIIYIDLIDSRDSILQTVKLPISSGLSWGSIKIADTAHEGQFRLRAYTRWMQNFDESFFYNHEFKILALQPPDYTSIKVNSDPVNLNSDRIKVNTDRQKLKKDPYNTSGNIGLNKQTTPGSANFYIQFFPEGGDLVTGIKSLIAIKAIGKNGLGLKLTGYIINKEKVRIAEFSTSALGMGSFQLEPLAGETYTAITQLKGETTEYLNLPAAKPEGITLAVNNESPDFLKVLVIPSSGIPHIGKITVIGDLNGIPYYISQSDIDGNIAQAKVKKSRFPTGILHLTVFSAQNQPMAERLVFIQHNDGLRVTLDLPKVSFQIREKVNINLTAKDSSGKPMIGSFSIAVTDDSRTNINEADQQTIFSDLLLSSELKGFIEQPNYYFINQDADKVKQLDLLLMTQGWSRFIWKDILSDKLPEIKYLPEKGIDIAGIVSYASRKPVDGGRVTLLSLTGNKFSLDTAISASGRFKFPNLVFADSSRLIIQAIDLKKKRNLRIDIDDNTTPKVKKKIAILHEEEPYSPAMLAYRQNSADNLNDLQQHGIRRGIMLKEVVVKASREDRVREVLKNSRNMNGAGNADKVLTYLDFQYCNDLQSCLQGKLAGVMINNGKAYSMRSPGRPMLLILDGMPVQNMSLDDLNINDIGSIELLKSASYLAIYGSQASGGALLITTKRGGIDYSIPGYKPAVDLARGFIFLNPKGYAVSKAFYSPAYPAPANNTRKDLRTTVYWQPNLVTGQEGKGAFSFYNSDNKGSYKVIIEGITADGKIGRQTVKFNVK